MTDTETKQETPSAEEMRNEKTRQQITVAIILAALVYWGINSPDTFLRVVLVALGFGGIVMIHEFGHFIVAKLGGIKVEAFSIGMGPVVFGIRKLKKGWRVRVFPKIGAPDSVEEGDNDTEYQIALLPIGGFVKMLGQSDTGAADEIDDPRSYANRPIWIRICVVSAGVIFNAVTAVLLFMALFLHGIDLKSAVVGDVIPNSPAYEAGLRPGDEVVEVNGERFVDFETLILAPALSAPGQPVKFTAHRSDGTEERLEIVAEKAVAGSSGLRGIGISKQAAHTLIIEPSIAKTPKDVDELYEKASLRPGDMIKTVEGQFVKDQWEYEKQIGQTFKPEVEISVLRNWPTEDGSEQTTTESVKFPIYIPATLENFRDEFDLTHFCSLVPRLMVEEVIEPTKGERFIYWVKTSIFRREVVPFIKDVLKKGDVLLKVADVDYPTYKQLRDLTNEYKDKELPFVVLRKGDEGVEQTVELVVRPKSSFRSKRVTVGFSPALDLEHPVVAQVLSVPGAPVGEAVIPKGALIVALNDKPVKNFFEIATVLKQNAGQRVGVAYELDGKVGAASVTVPLHDPVHAKASMAMMIPYKYLTTEFKTSNPIEAARWGLKTAWKFISQSYVTIGRLFQKDGVPITALSGPVGIISISYQMAGMSMLHYLRFLGLISSCLAVMNLLPLPVLDGGHIVLLLIEKITGKPVHEKILAPVMYIGLALLLGLILWISFNDIVRLLGF